MSRLRLLQLLTGISLFYLLFMTLEIPVISRTELGLVSPEEGDTYGGGKEEEEDDDRVGITVGRRRTRDVDVNENDKHKVPGLVFDDVGFKKNELLELHRVARDAFVLGKKVWQEIVNFNSNSSVDISLTAPRSESCPDSVTISGDEFREKGFTMEIPCGLTLGSHITVIGKPRWGHQEKDPQIRLVKGDESVMISEFKIDLQGLKAVDGEDPPRILHFNPRLKGDWSGKPVIEQNTCFRMQWGSALRCEGWKSRPDEDTGELSFFPFCILRAFLVCRFCRNLMELESDSFGFLRLVKEWNLCFLGVPKIQFHQNIPTKKPAPQPPRPPPTPSPPHHHHYTTFDGQVKCEKWMRDDDNCSEESKAWLNRLIGRSNKVAVDWPFPFVEDKLFILTLSAGLEGYHVNVDGRHITSFPYRSGFTLEDATGLSVKGDVDVHSIIAASLPVSNPNFGSVGHLEMSSKWEAPLLPDGPVELFIGILSAGNHFVERMAARKSWMQHHLIRSSTVVARFFVALHARKEVNLQLLKEADFFGDIVIVPYMDAYDLVVLKTVAICKYGMNTVSANYIMKGDDDTFVRVDAIYKLVKEVQDSGSVYVGNINYYHRPLRNGKWAVTFKEWPEEEYPPYANGPGYVISSNIAQYIVSKFQRHKLRLFKMEDVSMGMWVEQYNKSKPVKYVHSLKFCQFGCVEDYVTAHYQSPRQMICLWKKLQQIGKPQCCDMR